MSIPAKSSVPHVDQTRTSKSSIIRWTLQELLATWAFCDGPCLGAHQGRHAMTRFLEGFLEVSLKQELLRRVLRRRLIRVFSRDKDLLRREYVIEGA